MTSEQRHRDAARRLFLENGRHAHPLGTQTVEFWAVCVAAGERAKETEIERLREDVAELERAHLTVLAERDKFARWLRDDFGLTHEELHG